ncbi:MAG: YncE family protein [Gemmatimonadales bacterium]
MTARSLLGAVGAIALIAIAGAASARHAPAAADYSVIARHQIGGAGGWDYLTVDTAGHRLFVTRTDRVSAIDLRTGTVVAEVPGLNRGHGVAFDYAHHHGFASSGADSTVVMFDLGTMKEIGRTIAAVDDDAILFEPVTRQIFTFNGDANNATVIETAHGKRVGSIPLGGKPEFGVTDGHGTIWVNITDKGEIAQVDARHRRVTRRWSIAPCEHPSGLAIDVTHSRLFSVCGNKLMAVSDTRRGRLVTTVPIGAGVDAAGFDPSTGNAFASNGEGTLTVVHEETPDRYSVVQTLATMSGARTMTIDPATHRLYTVGAQFGPVPAAATTDNPRRRAPIVAGSVTVLEIAH